MGLRVDRVLGTWSLQTPPRPGRRAVGVPIGGAADFWSYSIANAALGNEADCPALEFGLAHAEIGVEADGAIALVGADAKVTVGSSLGVTNAVYPVRRGDRVVIAAPTVGIYVYVAFRPMPCDYRRLDRTAFSSSIRYVPIEGALDVHDRTFAISRRSNRLGVRLTGEIDGHQTEKPSEPMTPGAIQWTPSGELITIGPDGPTIGGYPLLGVVAEADYADLLQRRPDETIRFVSIDADEARRALRLRAKTVNKFRASVQFRGLR